MPCGAVPLPWFSDIGVLRSLEHPYRLLNFGPLLVPGFRVLCLVAFPFVTFSFLALIQLGFLVLVLLLQIGYLGFLGHLLFLFR